MADCVLLNLKLSVARASIDRSHSSSTKTQASHLILTYGTYSWLAALLSRASEVHVPFTRGAYEGLWYPAPLLLVDDAPEYVYHDVEDGGRGFLSAAMLVAQDTTYARAVKGKMHF